MKKAYAITVINGIETRGRLELGSFQPHSRWKHYQHMYSPVQTALGQHCSKEFTIRRSSNLELKTRSGSKHQLIYVPVKIAATSSHKTPKWINSDLQRFCPAFLLCFFALLMSCSDSGEENTIDHTNIESEEIRPLVIFDVSDDVPLNYYINTQGKVEPRRMLTLQSRVGGYIDHHIIREGAEVESGEILLQLVDDEWRLSLEDAVNELKRTESSYRIEKNLRLREFGSDALSEVDIRRLQNQLGYSQALIRQRQAELNLSYATVRAPFSGVIHTRENLSSGEYISAGVKLGRLIDHKEISVRFDLLESELVRVSRGMPVKLTTSFGSVIEGVVETVSPVINADSRTGQIVARFPNTDGIVRKGMTVDGKILVESITGRLRIPRSALLERELRSLVFKLNGDVLEWIYVDPVAITSEWVILNEENINPGDTFAVDRHIAVSHLQRVQVRMR